jgi:hypothetical protein
MLSIYIPMRDSDQTNLPVLLISCIEHVRCGAEGKLESFVLLDYARKGYIWCTNRLLGRWLDEDVRN